MVLFTEWSAVGVYINFLHHLVLINSYTVLSAKNDSDVMFC